MTEPSELYRRIIALEIKVNATAEGFAAHQATCLEQGKAAQESRGLMIKALEGVNAKLDVLTATFNQQRGAMWLGRILWIGGAAIVTWAATHFAAIR